MYANLILGILCTLMCLIIPNKKNALALAFLFITTFLAIRYNWGNDYASYLSMFDDFQGYGFDIFDIESSGAIRGHNEYGWVILNRLFGATRLGFFGMVIALTLFENSVVYYTIKKYVDPEYYWISVFLYIMSTSIFAIGASMMRQFFCICLYLIVVDLMVEKTHRGYLILSIFIIVVGSTIHRSNIFLLGTLPLFYINTRRTSKIQILPIIILLVFIVWTRVGPSLFSSRIELVLESSEDFAGYAVYLDDSGSISGFGFGSLYRYLLFGSLVFLLPHFEKHKQIVVILYLLSFFIMILAPSAPMINRFEMYFSILSILLWPWLFVMKNDFKFIYVLLVLELLIVLRGFFEFFSESVWVNAFKSYHTIFEAPFWM